MGEDLKHRLQFFTELLILVHQDGDVVEITELRRTG